MAALKVAIVIAVVTIAMLTQLELDEDPLVVERAVSIPSSKDKVFSYLADIENMANWFPDVVSEQPFDNSKIGVGKRYYEQIQLPIIGEKKAVLEITKYAPQKHAIVFESDHDWVLPRYEVKCIDHENENGKLRTKVIWKMYTRRRSYLYYGTVLQLLRLVMPDRTAGALFQLFYRFA
ncbi:uncharacterized protein [Ptychodera flava]|uniref:uncharacterized protein n=1 Tax=Ptychodera flava TaxID=63121 RepID=UPI00396A1534